LPLAPQNPQLRFAIASLRRGLLIRTPPCGLQAFKCADCREPIAAGERRRRRKPSVARSAGSRRPLKLCFHRLLCVMFLLIQHIRHHTAHIVVTHGERSEPTATATGDRPPPRAIDPRHGRSTPATGDRPPPRAIDPRYGRSTTATGDRPPLRATQGLPSSPRLTRSYKFSYHPSGVCRPWLPHARNPEPTEARRSIVKEGRSRKRPSNRAPCGRYKNL
jgi:hypothetical protein